jgi:hypothetical protein
LARLRSRRDYKAGLLGIGFVSIFTLLAVERTVFTIEQKQPQVLRLRAGGAHFSLEKFMAALRSG